MTYKNTVRVNITLNAGTLTQRGFGTPVFISAHRVFEDRVRSYGSLPEVLVDFAVDTDAYNGAAACFSQSPAPSVVKIGRRDAVYNYSMDTLTDDGVYGISITFNGATYSYSQAVDLDNVLYDTQEEILAVLAASINAEVDLAIGITASVAGTGAAAVLTITGNIVGDQPRGYFTAVSIGDASGTYAASESAAAVIAALDYEDADYYFVLCEDHSKVFITAMAAVIEAQDRQYFTSTAESNNLGTYVDDGSDTTIGGVLKQGNYTHTNVMFHHFADTIYPEGFYVSAGAPYDAGSITWCNIPMTGIEASKNTVITDPAKRKYINTNQKSNLTARNMNYIENDDVTGAVTRDGITSGGEWIDVIHGVHWQKNDLTINLKALLAGQKGGKLTGDDNGIARVREVGSSSLQRGVNRKFLSSFELFVPLQIDRSLPDIANRILTGVTFTGILANAIQYIEIDGTVTN